MKKKKKRMKINLLICFFFYLSLSACSQPINKDKLQNGDLIFQTSQSGQSKAIQLATGSKYSHVGVIYLESGKPYVLEAVQPVKKTPIDEWIARGDDGHYLVKRLEDNSEIIHKSPDKLIKSFNSYAGKNYDIYFSWSDEELYCSELVWKIYSEGFNVKLCELRKLKSFDLTSSVVKKTMAQRYGNAVPYEESVVAPGDLADSELLETIFKN